MLIYLLQKANQPALAHLHKCHQVKCLQAHDTVWQLQHRERHSDKKSSMADTGKLFVFQPGRLEDQQHLAFLIVSPDAWLTFHARLTFSLSCPLCAICRTMFSTPLAFSGFTKPILATASEVHSIQLITNQLKCQIRNGIQLVS